MNNILKGIPSDLYVTHKISLIEKLYNPEIQTPSLPLWHYQCLLMSYSVIFNLAFLLCNKYITFFFWEQNRKGGGRYLSSCLASKMCFWSPFLAGCSLLDYITVSPHGASGFLALEISVEARLDNGAFLTLSKHRSSCCPCVCHHYQVLPFKTDYTILKIPPPSVNCHMTASLKMKHWHKTPRCTLTACMVCWLLLACGQSPTTKADRENSHHAQLLCPRCPWVSATEGALSDFCLHCLFRANNGFALWSLCKIFHYYLKCVFCLIHSPG